MSARQEKKLCDRYWHVIGKKKTKPHWNGTFFFLLDLISARRRASLTKQYSESCLILIWTADCCAIIKHSKISLIRKNNGYVRYVLVGLLENYFRNSDAPVKLWMLSEFFFFFHLCFKLHFHIDMVFLCLFRAVRFEKFVGGVSDVWPFSDFPLLTQCKKTVRQTFPQLYRNYSHPTRSKFKKAHQTPPTNFSNSPKFILCEKNLRLSHDKRLVITSVEFSQPWFFYKCKIYFVSLCTINQSEELL